MRNASLLRQLLGTWTLSSYLKREADGRVVYPLGHSPVGYLIYTHDGFMSAQFMSVDRPHFVGKSQYDGRSHELARAASSYFAYCGPYSITADGDVLHHVVVSLFPNWVGGVQLRRIRVEGNILQIVHGSAPTTELVWHRAKHHTHDAPDEDHEHINVAAQQ